MTDEGRLNDELRWAGKAREVLEHEGFQFAFKQVEDALLDAMKAAPIENERLRLRLLDKYESLHAVRNVLTSMVDTGIMAEEEIKEIQLRQKTFSEKLKEFVGI